MTKPILYTSQYGRDSNTNLGAKIWYLVPQIIKEANS